MNFMGVGLLEILVIFLVAFLVLGPSRSISTARSAGKFLSTMRRTFNDVAAAASLEEETEQQRRDPPASGQGPGQDPGPDNKPTPKAGDE